MGVFMYLTELIGIGHSLLLVVDRNLDWWLLPKDAFQDLFENHLVSNCSLVSNDSQVNVRFIANDCFGANQKSIIIEPNESGMVYTERVNEYVINLKENKVFLEKLSSLEDSCGILGCQP